MSNSTMNTDGNVMPEEAVVEAPEQAGIDPKDELITNLAAERDQLKDQLLRVMAEAQNVQRRLRQQMEEDRKYSAQPLVERLLPVLDNFERSLAAAEKGASLESLVEGLKSIDKQLRSALESVKVQRIDAVGKTYDPTYHEALLTHETDEHPEETVTDEIEPGYTLHERVVRPAKVRVAKKP